MLDTQKNNYICTVILTIDMEPPSQVISNQLTGVGSDDPLSRLSIETKGTQASQGVRAAVVSGYNINA